MADKPSSPKRRRLYAIVAFVFFAALTGFFTHAFFTARNVLRQNASFQKKLVKKRTGSAEYKDWIATVYGIPTKERESLQKGLQEKISIEDSWLQESAEVSQRTIIGLPTIEIAGGLTLAMCFMAARPAFRRQSARPQAKPTCS